MQNLLESLDVAKAPGPDGIPTRILKLCAAEIAPILTVIFVLSLSSGQIPKDWLTANITPVFKKGDRGDPSNYRPILLTSVCCKILEHIIHRYIMKHLNANRILDTNQFGFRVGHSCEQQLISMIEEIQSAMDCRRQVDVIFLDFQKAFDTVPHQRLLKKLNHYGIRGNIYNWLDIWLTQRKQRAVVSGYESNFVSAKSGVPQGTVLGPLMFLIYINDIRSGVSSNLRLFADDCILYRVIECDHDHNSLQSDLDLNLKWTQLWQMSLNIRKCASVTCCRKPPSFPTSYSILSQLLQHVTEHPYLGVVIDPKMSFSSHIDHKTLKAPRMLNFIKRNLYKCNKEIKCMAYLSLVRPSLEYAASAWDPYLIKDITAIEKI